MSFYRSYRWVYNGGLHTEALSLKCHAITCKISTPSSFPSGRSGTVWYLGKVYVSVTSYVYVVVYKFFAMMSHVVVQWRGGGRGGVRRGKWRPNSLCGCTLQLLLKPSCQVTTTLPVCMVSQPLAVVHSHAVGSSEQETKILPMPLHYPLPLRGVCQVYIRVCTMLCICTYTLQNLYVSCYIYMDTRFRG